MGVMSRKFFCPVCFMFAAPSFKAIVRHVHSFDCNFQVISGCPLKYYNFHSYKKHLYRKPRDIMNNSSILDQNFVNTTFESPDFDDSSPHTRTLCTTNTLTLKHNAPLFLIRMKQEGKVSKKIMDRLVSDVIYTPISVQYMQSMLC